MEQSTKHMDIQTVWLLALINITNTAMAHETAEYNAEWSLLETPSQLTEYNIIMVLVKKRTWPLNKCHLHSLT